MQHVCPSLFDHHLHIQYVKGLYVKLNEALTHLLLQQKYSILKQSSVGILYLPSIKVLPLLIQLYQLLIKKLWIFTTAR